MAPRTQSLLLQSFGMLLALLVGMLLGQQFCTPQPEPPLRPECPEPLVPPRLVEVCPAPTPTPDPSHPAPPRPRATPPTASEKLPEAPPPTSHDERRQLLSWVRTQSPSLQSCPRDRSQTFRLSITLEINAALEITSVHLHSDHEALPPELSSCLTERIRRWALPAALPLSQNRLLFRLTL